MCCIYFETLYMEWTKGANHSTPGGPVNSLRNAEFLGFGSFLPSVIQRSTSDCGSEYTAILRPAKDG